MKFKVAVTKTYTQDAIVEADDADHAREIAKEISDEMVTDFTTFFESNWDVTQVDDSSKVTYEPQQDYLK
ncbi:hypothetical protein KTH06_10310 [Acinetobacter ursingii]|uniref:hypothetical protein n=1 Tax=Acinetobacter ursingii TaxID=108980 RepID=UPI000F798695|nr:hypothetical protein [Acinetobacter ursingii]MCU4306222.1 hypothetical protein [Acinetobacter ursingii]MCU4372307.1 hypothetical protein [Acinetobacter ursingii]RSO80067.1 hypothetical protein EA748_16425 [Acinetobacter ursingii]